MSSRQSRYRLVAALLLLALAFALRLYGIGQENFWIDEIFQLRVSAQSLHDILANYRPGMMNGSFSRDQAPLSHLVYHFFVSEGGSETLSRLPSAIFGTLGVAATLVLALRLLPFKTAMIAALFLAVSPLDLWYSQECRFYALWKLLATVSYVTLVQALEGGRTRWWAAYGLLSIAGLYTSVMHGLVILAQTVTVAWLGNLSGRTRAFAVRFCATMLIVAAATLPVSRIVLSERQRTAGTPRPDSVSVLPYTFFAFAIGYSLGPTVESLHYHLSPFEVVAQYPSIWIVFAVFLPVAIAGALRLGFRSRAAGVILPWVLLPVLGLFVLSLVSNITHNVRYAFTSLPAFFLVIAVGCMSFAARPLRAAAVAAVLACLVVSVANFYWNDVYDKEHVRDTLNYVETAGHEENRVIVIGDVSRAFDYYSRGSRTSITPACGNEETTPTLWVAAGRDWDGRVWRCLDELSERYGSVDERNFVGVKLWRLERTPTDTLAAQ